MTRLTYEELREIAPGREAYDSRLAHLTGLDLVSLAGYALGLHSPRQYLQGKRIAVVPITSGQGRIAGFAESLCAIAGHMGCQGTLMPPDEQGFALAAEGGHDIVLWSDDDLFYAKNLHSGCLSENGVATGFGFAAALTAMLYHTKDLPLLATWDKTQKNSSVFNSSLLVLGCGPVGEAGASWLVRQGYGVTLCDISPQKAQAVASVLKKNTDVPVQCVTSGQLALLSLEFIGLLDAAPTDTVHPDQQLKPDVCIAAPCVPCTWDHREHLWHDPLQTGTAVMILAAAANIPLLPFGGRRTDG